MDECVFLRADQLKLSSNDKHRSFSTSTPFLNVPEHKLHTLSVSVCCSTENDSGLGASLSDVSVSSLANVTAPIVTVTSCQTPPCCVNIPPFCGPNLDICVSPVSSKRHPSRSKFSLHLNEEESFDSCNRTISIDESKSSRLLNKSVSRKLNLDLNIYENNEASCKDKPSCYESQLAAQFDHVLQKFSPAVNDRIIGRKMGRETVDILGELSFRNIRCVSTILSYLDPQDLCRLYMVSKQWKLVCESDKPANKRRRRFLRQHRETRKKMGKENAVMKSVRVQRTEPTVLQDVNRLEEHLNNPCTDITKTTTEQFMAVGSSLKNEERLQKCPRCRSPAKVLPIQDRGKCQNQDCGYDFCVKCVCEFHGSKECTPIVIKKVKTDSIGSRKSKKNLKRL